MTYGVLLGRAFGLAFVFGAWGTIGNQMKLSSYDGTLHRAQRLAKVAKLACATIGITSDQSQLLIRSLHDHKGHLTVTWMFAPTEHQRNAFAVAWDLVGEHRDAVAHEVLHDAT